MASSSFNHTAIKTYSGTATTGANSAFFVTLPEGAKYVIRADLGNYPCMITSFSQATRQLGIVVTQFQNLGSNIYGMGGVTNTNVSFTIYYV